jgi:hypothetical protein
LFAIAHEWETATGTPTVEGLQIDCEKETDEDEETNHRWWQSEWQPVRDAVAKWAGAK